MRRDKGRAASLGSAAVAAAGVAMAAGAARADIVYSNVSANFIGDANTLQTITPSPAASGFTLNYLPDFLIYYADVPTTDPVLVLQFFTNVDNTSASSATTDALANATFEGSEGFTLPDTGVTAGNAYDFTLGSAADPFGVNVSSGTFGVQAIFLDGSDPTLSTLSTDVADVYSTANPTVGSATTFTYIDGGNAGQAADGVFQTNERFDAGNNPTVPLGIAFSLDATPIASVPEPSALAGAVLGGVALIRRRGRRQA